TSRNPGDTTTPSYGQTLPLAVRGFVFRPAGLPAAALMIRRDRLMKDLNAKRLFWASFFTLIAAGIGFSVRGVGLLSAWRDDFGFTMTALGGITGGGLVGFGITIILLSFIADRIGYGPLMVLAFLLHVSSALVTLAATPVY